MYDYPNRVTVKYALTLHNLECLSKEALDRLKGSNTMYTLISGVDKKAFEALEANIITSLIRYSICKIYGKNYM